ncbi:lysozyme family protein [Streptococcus moroccensis]|uniref:Soluble lytic murein transglycosylase-like protein n=1 Tax=Streptococcus moroccensis TaxID=1451356 RepID=A0ABT9YP13_9STRE|nr:lysozyme family protein [Streptococcus moroccensis]MDQ0221723.1 soluble lytic murein transglycosylase-like protein [Streptococcus moroccensis]
MMKKLWRFFLLILTLGLLYQGYKLHKDVSHVLTYRSLVREVIAETGSSVDEDLVLAMIYTETKGKSDDVMQSSESIHGTANTITDSKESIRQGIQVLVDNVAYAEELGIDTWTAVQAYNFGKNYMDYVASHGGENLIKVAKAYSRDVVAPSLGNTTGLTYRYLHPIALLHGGELYVNGGNIYYSRQVRVNMYLLEIMSWF